MTKSKTKTTPANVDALINTTTTNLAYQYARTQDAGLGIAGILYARYPQGMSDEARDEVKAGFLMQYSELCKPVTYLKDGADTYTKVDRPLEGDEVGMTMSIDLALGYTSHEFGKLKAEQPNYHAIVKESRDKANKYVSNKSRRLDRDLAEYAANGGSKPRRPNKDWQEAIDSAVETLAKRAKDAKIDKSNFRAEVIAKIDAMKW